MKTALITFFLFTQCILGQSVHDIHISRAELNYDQKSKSIQITLHVYIDDLESAIKKSGQPTLYIGSSKEVKDADELIKKYLKKVLQISNQNVALNYNWVGKELADSPLAIWCYLEVENVNNLDGLTLKNEVLMDLYDDQTNIIETKINNKPIHTTVVKSKGKLERLRF